MDFSNALKGLKAGLEVRREEWSPGRFLGLLTETKTTICEYPSVDPEVPTIWIPTPGDLLAEDWELL